MCPAKVILGLNRFKTLTTIRRLGEIESVAVRTTIQATDIDSFIQQLKAGGKTNRRERILASTKASIHICTRYFGNDTDGEA
ncbi:MAG: hypothetical protein WB630_17875 [Candidatus Acidiferrales bacterium]